jgi:hypothetical protein
MREDIVIYERGDGEMQFTAIFRHARSIGRPIIVEIEEYAGSALCLVTEASEQGLAAYFISESGAERAAGTRWVNREAVVRAYQGPDLNG